MVQLCVTFGFILMLDCRLIADLQKIASLDILTGALNRRRLDEEGNRLWARSRRTGDVLAIMMIGVDHFIRLSVKAELRRQTTSCENIF